MCMMICIMWSIGSPALYMSPHYWNLWMNFRVSCPIIWHHVSPFAHPLMPSVVNIILISIRFSFRPDAAMLFIMVKACLCFKQFLFIAILKEFMYLYWILNRMGNVHLQRHFRKYQERYGTSLPGLAKYPNQDVWSYHELLQINPIVYVGNLVIIF